MNRLFVASLAFVVPFSMLACQADAADDALGEGEEGVTGTTDVSASYVGRFAGVESTNEITNLLLAKGGHYTLARGAVREEGTYGVFQGATTQLRITSSVGGTKIYRASLGGGARPRLTLVRSGKTSALERDPLTCAASTCATGSTCVEGEKDGVPSPTCKTNDPVWVTAFAAHKTWGVSFQNASTATPNGFQRALNCVIEAGRIACGVTGYDAPPVSAAFAADGTFAASFGTPAGSNGDLRGRVGLDASVTVEHFASTTCFTTSSTWCEKDETPRAATAKAFELCRMPDRNFGQGGWAAGYYLACSQCSGQCVGGR